MFYSALALLTRCPYPPGGYTIHQLLPKSLPPICQPAWRLLCPCLSTLIFLTLCSSRVSQLFSDRAQAVADPYIDIGAVCCRRQLCPKVNSGELPAERTGLELLALTALSSHWTELLVNCRCMGRQAPQ
ncbi:hypothetical protein BDV98DRAFT_571673, partial [Pterulicium gracile]